MPDIYQDFRLGEFTVHPQQGKVVRGGESRRLKPKAMAVLARLARAPGNVVSRHELFDAVWPGQSVSDDVLTTSVVELRRALGDSAKKPRYIETIPRRGLRLVAQVSEIDKRPARARDSTAVRTSFVLAAGLLLVGMAVWTLRAGDPFVEPVAEGPVSVAVLPFADLSTDGSRDYFADGLTEELIARLSQLDHLLVTARTSSFRFKEKSVDIRDIGRQLAVGHVLRGSVRRSDDALRITAQLTDVSSGFHVWSDTYEGRAEEVFEIQTRIAESVATALSVTLGVGELGVIDGGTRNVKAFDQAALGAAALEDMSAASVLAAIDHYRRAVELDASYALAWSRLAGVYRKAWLVLGNDRIDEFSALADEALARALTLAPESEEILWHAAFAEVSRANWIEARKIYDDLRARGGNRGLHTTASLDLMTRAGFSSAGLAIRELMLLVDPLNADAAMYFAHLYLMQGQVDDALDELERAYELELYRVYTSVEGLVAALTSGDDRAISHWLDRAVLHQQPGAKGVHEEMRDRLDDPDAALQWLREGFEAEAIPEYFVTIWASYFGEYELALAALQRFPDPWAFWIPLTAPLRKTDGFRDLLVDHGLVDYFRTYGWNDFCRPIGDADFRCD